MNHRPRKRFGQHFLTAPDVIDQICSAIDPREGDTIVEIGPGQGAITDPLSIRSPVLHAIEFDRDLVQELRDRYASRPQVSVHEADALRFDYASLATSLRLVGNLPYNISTPLLFWLLRFREIIVDAHFMLQKEVVDRICAEPGGKDFGRLTIMLGCHMESVALFDVPPDAFTPPPRVMSSVVRMRPLAPGAPVIADESTFDAMVKLAFSRRRKTLKNALQGMAGAGDIEHAGLDPRVRPEQVEIREWVALANIIAVRD